MSDELDVCHFCGAQHLLNEIAPHTHNLTIGSMKFPDHPGSWTIECPACECGMIADTKEAVTVARNRRAQPAEKVQPVAEVVAASDGKGKLLAYIGNSEDLPVGTALYTRPPAADADRLDAPTEDQVLQALAKTNITPEQSRDFILTNISGERYPKAWLMRFAQHLHAALAASKEKKE